MRCRKNDRASEQETSRHGTAPPLSGRRCPCPSKPRPLPPPRRHQHHHHHRSITPSRSPSRSPLSRWMILRVRSVGKSKGEISPRDCCACPRQASAPAGTNPDADVDRHCTAVGGIPHSHLAEIEREGEVDREREGEIESPLPARYEHASDVATGMAIRLDGAGARLASRCCSPISSEYILSLGNHETAHRTLGENFPPPPPPLPGYWGRREGSRERGREAEKLRRCLRTCSGFRYAISS